MCKHTCFSSTLQLPDRKQEGALLRAWVSLYSSKEAISFENATFRPPAANHAASPLARGTTGGPFSSVVNMTNSRRSTPIRRQSLLLVDHGSVKAEANELLEQVAQMLRSISTFEIVHYAHMDLAEPSIQMGFDACVAEGAEEVIVHPYFLSPGRHSKEDIPRLVAEAQQKHPQVAYRVTQPLGLDRIIGELILKRIEESGETS